MKKQDRSVYFVAVTLAAVLGFSPLVQHTRAAPPQDGGPGQGNVHRDDPCDQLPNPPGKANGIDKQCPGGGSSSGIAKGDFNGDGFADLAVGVPDEDLGTAVSAGGVDVIYGSGNGLTTSDVNVPAAQFWAEGLLRIPGLATSGDRFGASLASGDFNGDGYSDLAIGIPNKTVNGNSGSGAVVVIYGSRNGLTTSDSSVPGPRSFNLTISPLSVADPFCGDNGNVLKDANFGQSLAWGDFNHDGIGDLAIGIPGFHFTYTENLVPCVVTSPGAILVLAGSGGGLITTGNQLVTEEDVQIQDPFGMHNTSGDRFGAAVSSGDFNGDGNSDLAVGVPFRTVGTVGTCGANPIRCHAGAVDILYGFPFGLSTVGAQIWSQTSANIVGAAENDDHFGASLAAGDFNGDGKSDLAIGVPNEDIGSLADAGAVNVIYGSSAGLTATGNQFWDQLTLGGVNEAGARFGTALAAGDFNADGRADLAVGVPFKDVPGVTDAGEVDVIYGAVSGLSTAGRSPQVWYEGSSGIGGTPKKGDRFGQSLTAWNFGRDEVFFQPFPNPLIVIRTTDLAIGVPYKQVGTAAGAGAVHVIYGSSAAKGSNGLASTGNQIWTQNSAGMPCCSESGDHFGLSVY
jgi:FG-GAP repeat